MSAAMKAVIVSFDRLPLSFLGCYGNSQVETPHFDRLAAQSVVYDQHFAENIDSTAVSHTWATGCFHFLRSSEQQQTLPDIGDWLSQTGVASTQICERNSLTRIPQCRRAIEIEGRDGLAVSPDETPVAQVVSRAAAELRTWSSDDASDRLLWLHACGVPFPWIPPRYFARRAIAGAALWDDEEDEEPLDEHAEARPPAEAALYELPDETFDEIIYTLLEAVTDEELATELASEEWQIARAVLAGYVELIDESLGRLLDVIEETIDPRELLLVVTAAQGVAAGERAMMSLPEIALSEAKTHTPLLVRFPSGTVGIRREDLVQTVDLVPTLLEWFQLDSHVQNCEGRSLLPTTDSSSPRESICLGDGSTHHAIRTPDRLLILPLAAGTTTDDRPQLFVKPDDVWNVNEVAGQSPDEVDSLTAELEQFIEQTV